MTQSLPAGFHAGVSPAGGAVQVVVVGAGPYGLSVAAHLRAAGIRVRVFGEVMGSWRHAMATGMFLKSTPEATDLSAPEPGGRLEDFCRERGEPVLTELTPIPCTTFVDYGQWFQQRYAGDIDPSRMERIERREGGFTLRLNGGERLAASAVVVATGLTGLARLPQNLVHIAPDGLGPEAPLSHTSQHRDLSRYAGLRVAVIGGGQSALESAALLHESGARVDVLVRAGRVRWGERPVLDRPPVRRLIVPSSPLGSGWVVKAVSQAPGGVQVLPARARMVLLRRALGPSGGWWLRERVENIVPVHTGRHITAAHVGKDGLRLELSGAGSGPRELVVDHVLAATGYRLDLDAMSFLCPHLRATVKPLAGSRAPRLSAAFESSVPGLFFTGSMAAPSFGPVMRFVAGTAYTARRITARITRYAPTP
ncbi:FAD-dependent oxidoreductase [Streptomyces syringium]|uniref:FAD-dependent oxidoreductase n=1 Tax=Streptomyces syringium TaxID=76729 RepID=UPI0033B19322